MSIDRNAQNARAQTLYAADPFRKLDPDTCWVAACIGAWELMAGEYSALRFKVFVDHYGLEAVDG
jgi:hypothetical protein